MHFLPPFANQFILRSTTNKVIFFWMNSTRSKWKSPTPTFCILAFLAFWSSLRPSFLAYQMEANIVWLSGISPFELWVNTVEESPVSASERQSESESERGRERDAVQTPLPSVIIYTYTLSLEQVREKEGGQKETDCLEKVANLTCTLFKISLFSPFPSLAGLFTHCQQNGESSPLWYCVQDLNSVDPRPI